MQLLLGDAVSSSSTASPTASPIVSPTGITCCIITHCITHGIITHGIVTHSRPPWTPPLVCASPPCPQQCPRMWGHTETCPTPHSLCPAWGELLLPQPGQGDVVLGNVSPRPVHLSGQSQGAEGTRSSSMWHRRWQGCH